MSDMGELARRLGLHTTFSVPSWAGVIRDIENEGYRIVRADSLDAAWADAEAALPEGWRIKSLSMDAPPAWQAWAGATPEEAPGVDEWEAETGSTPAAALRALAERLRERAG
jgi:hypothetical protein